MIFSIHQTRRVGVFLQVLLLANFCGLLVFLPLGEASQESTTFVDQGFALLQEKEYSAALPYFQQAFQSDPQDSEALFFLGVTFNRLGQYQKALSSLFEAERLGEHHADLRFELGWSHLSLGEFKEAVEHLVQYDQAHPGRGQTSEFLGRAYYNLGKYDEAVEHLNEAVVRDPTLRSTVNFTLTLIASDRKNVSEALAHFQGLKKYSGKGDPLTRFLQPYFEQPGSAPQKPWQVSLSASGGYNDNVLGLSGQEFLPSDISSQASPFARILLNAQYDHPLTQKTTIGLQYNLFADVYSDLPSFDLQNHGFFFNGTHYYSQDITLSLQISNQYTVFGGAAFRNQVGFRPAVTYHIKDWAPLELAYSFSYGDYFLTSVPIQDRTGSSQTFSLTQYVQIASMEILLHGGYFYTLNLTKGSDFDVDIHGLRAGINAPLAWKIVGDIFYSRTYDVYKNANSLALFTLKRSDTVDSLSIQITRPIDEWIQKIFPPVLPSQKVQLFVLYNFLEINSNISVVGFSQNAVNSGLVVSF